jgi:hypothetical protein
MTEAALTAVKAVWVSICAKHRDRDYPIEYFPCHHIRREAAFLGRHFVRALAKTGRGALPFVELTWPITLQ